LSAASETRRHGNRYAELMMLSVTEVESLMPLTA